MKELQVNCGENSYPIIIGRQVLEQCGPAVRRFTPDQMFLVSNPKVFSLYGEKVVDSFEQAGLKVMVYLMPDGEPYKNLTEAGHVLDQAVDAKLERTGLVAALGGGVVGDLAGFAASVYMRGIDFVQIPTTLLAQVDASVGGKVAVNHPGGKNLIGNFHQPRMVLIDIATLNTLEPAEYRSGLAEVVKYGLIFSREFFDFIENNVSRINDKKEECLQTLIYTACSIKAEIVGQDEKEMGIRAILNLGHTFGHALEKLTGYGFLRHGEAVAIGTMAACYLSQSLGLMDAQELIRVERLYRRLGLLPSFPDLDNKLVYEAMLNDKKMRHGKLRIVIPPAIGNYKIVSGVDPEQIIQALNLAREFCDRQV